jgi:hypothetical protein
MLGCNVSDLQQHAKAKNVGKDVVPYFVVVKLIEKIDLQGRSYLLATLCSAADDLASRLCKQVPQCFA